MKKHERILIVTAICLMGAAIMSIAMECLLLKTGHTVMATYADGTKDMLVAAMVPVGFMIIPSLFDEDEEA